MSGHAVGVTLFMFGLYVIGVALEKHEDNDSMKPLFRMAIHKMTRLSAIIQVSTIVAASFTLPTVVGYVVEQTLFQILGGTLLFLVCGHLFGYLLAELSGYLHLEA